jgi:hypothetical protein
MIATFSTFFLYISEFFFPNFTLVILATIPKRDLTLNGDRLLKTCLNRFKKLVFKKKTATKLKKASQNMAKYLVIFSEISRQNIPF